MSDRATKSNDLFILDGQKVMVVEMDEPFISDYGRQDRRLRVVYDNSTESDLLLRSLQRALNKDEVIEEVMEKIQAGTIDQFRYDPKTASLTRCSTGAASRTRSVVIDKS
jgi:hypothetical protein